MTYTVSKRDHLKEKREEHRKEIEDIDKRIDSLPPDAQVNEMYARINYLAVCIQRIDEELFYLESLSGKLDDAQAQKAFDIISGGGGVDIRPKADEVVDPENKLELNRPVTKGQKFAAPDPVKP